MYFEESRDSQGDYEQRLAALRRGDLSESLYVDMRGSTRSMGTFNSVGNTSQVAEGRKAGEVDSHPQSHLISTSPPLDSRITQSALNYLVQLYPGDYNTFIGYDEKVGHEAYASADFLLMPSRVEPCGLNQLYALRYGTIPMVRDTGGLHDTVVDMGDAGGFGIKFLHATEADIVYSIERAITVYKDKKQMNTTR